MGAAPGGPDGERLAAVGSPPQAVGALAASVQVHVGPGAAERGGGAYLNGQPVRASDCAALESCAMLSHKGAFSSGDWPEPWPEMRFESRNSVALRMALVAAGAFDATVAMTPKNDWDIAAGIVIAEEAGAVVSDHRGRKLELNRPSTSHPSLVVAAPALHPLISARTAPIDLAADE